MAKPLAQEPVLWGGTIRARVNGVECEFTGERCRDGMDILLHVEKMAGGPPAVDHRWDALQRDLQEKKNADARSRR